MNDNELLEKFKRYFVLCEALVNGHVADESESDVEQQPPKQQPVQDQLADIVTGADFNFEAWREWAAEQGHIQDRELPAFDVVPDAVAQRLVRAQKGMIQQLKAKGVA